MTRTQAWTPADVPDLGGRRALVTGATSPVAERLVAGLARHGAEVILAAGDPARLEASISRVCADVPDARLRPLALDAGDLRSVRRAAGQVSGLLHLLVHQADAAPDAPARTADGLEPRMAARLFGPFALTGLLFPRLVASGDGRVVTLTSPAARLARRAPLEDPFEDPFGASGRHRHRRSRPGHRAGGRSGLGALMFALELDGRAREQKAPVRSLAAHCGLTTGLAGGEEEDADGVRARMRLTSTIGAAAAAAARQSDDLVAGPVLMAATADLPGSTLVGPGGVGQLRGTPRVLGVGPVARDAAARSRLWQICEEVTAVRFLGG